MNDQAIVQHFQAELAREDGWVAIAWEDGSDKLLTTDGFMMLRLGESSPLFLVESFAKPTRGQATYLGGLPDRMGKDRDKVDWHGRLNNLWTAYKQAHILARLVLTPWLWDCRNYERTCLARLFHFASDAEQRTVLLATFTHGRSNDLLVDRRYTDLLAPDHFSLTTKEYSYHYPRPKSGNHHSPIIVRRDRVQVALLMTVVQEPLQPEPTAPEGTLAQAKLLEV